MALDCDFNSLVDFLSSPAWELRREAAQQLGHYGAPEAIPYLLRGLSDSVGAVQRATAVALGQIGTEAVVPYLLACLDNPSFRFPAPVLEALGNMRVKQAIPYFIGALRHRDAHVRRIANSCLMVTTTQAFGFRARADEARRNKAIQKWEAWWSANYDTFEVQ
jgi:HEAT repeat protein